MEKITSTSSPLNTNEKINEIVDVLNENTNIPITAGDGINIALSNVWTNQGEKFVINDSSRNIYDGHITALDYCNGKFIAFAFCKDVNISSPGVEHYMYCILTSSDGINWSEPIIDNVLWGAPYYGGQYETICYGNGKYIALSASGEHATSSDGINWTKYSQNMDLIHAKSVVYVNNKFICLTGDGRILTSSDGINWTAKTNTGIYVQDGYIWENMAYGNNKFVANGYLSGNKWAVSDDGETWTEVTISNLSGYKYSNLCFDGSNFMTITNGATESSNGAKVATSPDGTNWTVPATDEVLEDVGSTKICYHTAYGKGKVVAIYYNSEYVFTCKKKYVISVNE